MKPTPKCDSIVKLTWVRFPFLIVVIVGTTTTAQHNMPSQSRKPLKILSKGNWNFSHHSLCYWCCASFASALSLLFTFHQQFYTSSLSVGAEHAVADTREFQISIDDFFFIIFARRSQTHTVVSAGKRRMLSNRVNTDAMWKNCLISNKLRRRDRGGWRRQLTWKDEEKIFINSKLNSFIWNFPYDEFVHGDDLLCTMAAKEWWHIWIKSIKKSTKAHERADQQQKGTMMTWKCMEGNFSVKLEISLRLDVVGACMDVHGCSNSSLHTK